MTLPMRILTLGVLSSSLLAMLAFNVSAQDEEGKAEPKPEPEPVSLRWDYTEGKEHKYRLVQTMKQQLDLGGDVIETLNANTTDWTDRCVGFTEENAVKLEYVYDRLAFKIKAESIEVNYDTADPDPAELEKLPDIKGLASLAGKKFSYEVTPELKVQNLQGWDVLREQILEMYSPVMRQQMEPTFTDSTRIEQLEAMLRALPRTKVKPGDTWTNSATDPAGQLGHVKVDLTYTLDSLEATEDGDFATISFKGEGEFVQDKEGPMKDWKVTIKDFEYTGTFRFDRKQGRCTSQSTTNKFSMEFVTDTMTMTQVVEIGMTVESLPDEPKENDKAADKEDDASKDKTPEKDK